VTAIVTHGRADRAAPKAPRVPLQTIRSRSIATTHSRPSLQPSFAWS